MSTTASAEIAAARPAMPVSSSEWARRINRMVREQVQASAGMRSARAQANLLAPVAPAGAAAASALESIQFSGTAAESVVRQGLRATLLTELAQASGLDSKHLYEFTGIDRSTVSRKAARDDALPQEVAIKALEFAQLIATGADVFGTVADASRWLTRPHPALDGETPLHRARTPWGLDRVRAMLGALKYGGPV